MPLRQAAGNVRGVRHVLKHQVKVLGKPIWPGDFPEVPRGQNDEWDPGETRFSPPHRPLMHRRYAADGEWAGKDARGPDGGHPCTCSQSKIIRIPANTPMAVRRERRTTPLASLPNPA